MTDKAPRVAIIGAGIGGLTAAACLRRMGVDARIYEQARGFTRLGAGIQQSPNSIRVLFALGLEEKLRALAFQPDSNDSRDFDTAISGIRLRAFGTLRRGGHDHRRAPG